MSLVVPVYHGYHSNLWMKNVVSVQTLVTFFS